MRFRLQPAGVAVLGDLSRLLNRALGGPPGKTLCWRWSVGRSPDCLPCRVIGWVLRDPYHCRDEMTAAEFVDWRKRQSQK